MSSGIWNYLTGYVIIQIKGRSLERFLNRASQNGVRLWNIRRDGPNSIVASVDINGLLRLKKLKRGVGCHIHILQKQGLPITLCMLRFRPVLALGWLAIAVLLLAATRCIWFIDVQGCDNVPEARIEGLLQEEGVRAGIGRRGLVLGDIAAAITAADDRIAWTFLELSGVVLKVEISEVRQHKPQLNESIPASIYAACDGRIVSLTALNGRAMAKPGDVVQKGQLLISGVLQRTEESEPVYVRARGNAVAEVVYVFSCDAGPKLAKPVRTGNNLALVELEALGLRFSGISKGYPQSELERGSPRMLKNCFIPLTVTSIDCHETQIQSVRAEPQELEAQAEAGALKLLENGLPDDARLLAKETVFHQREHGVITAVITAVAQLDIGIVEELK